MGLCSSANIRDNTDESPANPSTEEKVATEENPAVEKVVVKKVEKEVANAKLYSWDVRDAIEASVAKGGLRTDYDSGNTIVIHNGSGMTTIGFTEDVQNFHPLRDTRNQRCQDKEYSSRDAQKKVSAHFPSIVGDVKASMRSVQVDFFVGDDASMGDDAGISSRYSQNISNIAKTSSPIEYGIVNNWEDMEKIWHHSFYNVLRVDPSKFGVIISEPPRNPKANRDKIVRSMFDTFKVAKLCVMSTMLANLWGDDPSKDSGVVLDVGHTMTTVGCIHEGYVLPHTVSSSHIGGRDLTNFLKKLLFESCQFDDRTSTFLYDILNLLIIFFLFFFLLVSFCRKIAFT